MWVRPLILNSKWSSGTIMGIEVHGQRSSCAVWRWTGTPNATSAASREEATAQRDAGLQAWFEAEAGRLLLSDDSAATIMALTREVCGLKLAQSQLAANEGAARTRLAAAQKSESQLQKQLEVHYPPRVRPAQMRSYNSCQSPG